MYKWSLVAVIVVMLGTGAYLYNSVHKNMNETGMEGTERARELIFAYSEHIGANGRVLNVDNTVSYGDSELQYDPERDVLIGRLYVNMARTEGAPMERHNTYQEMLEALNDPKIGGMFEKGGGMFVLDEEEGAWFLVKEFPVVSTSQATLVEEMNELSDIASAWTTKWFLDVAMIMHGKEKAPSMLVTRENDLQ